MKYLTVLIDEAADVDQLKEESERAASEKKNAELATAQTAEEPPSSDAPADAPAGAPADVPETPTQAAEAPTTESSATETPDSETGKEA